MKRLVLKVLSPFRETCFHFMQLFFKNVHLLALVFINLSMVVVGLQYQCGRKNIFISQITLLENIVKKSHSALLSYSGCFYRRFFVCAISIHYCHCRFR